MPSQLKINNKSSLNIITALHCEAKPLIEYFHLKKINVNNGTAFPIFSNPGKNIHLIVSGVGKIKTAIATTYLSQINNNASYLNLGVAGSLEYPIGEMVLANKIVEHSTQRAWYPYIAPLKNIPQTTLTTFDKAQTTYPKKGIIDMEGAAFFQAASYFVTQEQIQIIKIVSDNNSHTLNNLNENTIQTLISNNLSRIQQVTDYLLGLSNQEINLTPDLPELTPFQTRWHFTQTQSLQLQELLRRWQIQYPRVNAYNDCQTEKSAAKVIAKLRANLDESLFLQDA